MLLAMGKIQRSLWIARKSSDCHDEVPQHEVAHARSVNLHSNAFSWAQSPFAASGRLLRCLTEDEISELFHKKDYVICYIITIYYLSASALDRTVGFAKEHVLSEF